VRAGDVPRILAGLNGRHARAEGTRCRRRHPRALSLRSWLDRRRLSPCSVSGKPPGLSDVDLEDGLSPLSSDGGSRKSGSGSV
jgi:hypothetical protein